MKRPLLNLRHLRAFCEVAKLGSITEAADRVNLSQPAVTQAIGKLEQTLSGSLFLRGRSGMFLTPGGEIFQKRAARALALIEQGTKQAIQTQARRRGRQPNGFHHQITSTQIRALLAVEDSGNFSLAARQIGLSQPSLHRMARDLERVSDLVLYQKTPQGIILTEPARILSRFFRLCLSELRQGFEELDALSGVDSGDVIVGTLPLARSFILPRALNEMTMSRPSVSIKIIDGPYPDLLHALRHGEIDMIIGALRDPVPVEDVTQERLFDDGLSIVARSGHVLSSQETVSIEDLRLFPWVVPRPGTPTRSNFDALFHSQGYHPPGNLTESSSLILIRGILLGSDRLTIISSHQVRDELASGLLKKLPVDLRRTIRPIGVTTRKDWEPTSTQQEFLNLIRKASVMLAD